jgi:hypothetical protein
MKFCKDCTHFERTAEICNSEQSIRGVDIIWGRHEKMSAREMRGTSNKCGLAAVLFEQVNATKFIEGLV